MRWRDDALLSRATSHDLAQLAQLGFHDRGVVFAHAQQKFLPRGQRLELWVCELIKHMRLHQRDGAGYFRRGKQAVDNFNESVVKILSWIAQILIGFLE